MEYVITAAVVLAANLLSNRVGSWLYESATAVFGWIGAVSMLLWLVSHIASAFFPSTLAVSKLMAPIWMFCVMTAIARDYEKILKPWFDRFIEKQQRRRERPSRKHVLIVYILLAFLLILNAG